jgi:hypothetical protein
MHKFIVDGSMKLLERRRRCAEREGYYVQKLLQNVVNNCANIKCLNSGFILHYRTDSPKNNSKFIVEDNGKQTLQHSFSIVQFNHISLVWFNVNEKIYTRGSVGRTHPPTHTHTQTHTFLVSLYTLITFTGEQRL